MQEVNSVFFFNHFLLCVVKYFKRKRILRCKDIDISQNNKDNAPASTNNLLNKML